MYVFLLVPLPLLRRCLILISVYKKAGFKTFVTLHKILGVAGEQLASDGVTIISACLKTLNLNVVSIMAPMGDISTYASGYYPEYASCGPHALVGLFLNSNSHTR